jgi:hypothetical protein
MSKNEIEKRENAALAMFDFGEDAGKGVNMEMDDLKIPFLKLLQALSPAVQKGTDTYVEGAEPGMLMNSATDELFDGAKGISLVLAFKRTSFVEWRPNRGGFAGDHDIRSKVVLDAKANAAKSFELYTEDGNSLEQTNTLYALQLDDKGKPVGYLVIPFTSSKIPEWKSYFTKLDTAKIPDTDSKVTDVAPLFAMGVQLVSKAAVNKKNEPYKNYELRPQGGDILKSVITDKSSEAYIQAKALHEAIDAGRAKADYDTHENAGAANDSEEVPF